MYGSQLRLFWVYDIINKDYLTKLEVRENAHMSRVDELLNTPYWIVDILPTQVPKDSPGQYFKIEEFFLREQLEEIKKKHLDLILKLNCYMDIAVDGEINPTPERIRAVMDKKYVYIMVGESMILSEPDDTHLTVFNPDWQLLELIKTLAAGEGLFVWKP